MENNLYYTPTIEEFHVGFEYYLLGSKIIAESIHDIELTLDNPIQVKYLDQSDIESLNLNNFEITECVKESHVEFTWFKGIELFGLITFTDRMISFYEYDYSTKEYSDCIFRGTIKNKSELIKLMKQLNIK